MLTRCCAALLLVLSLAACGGDAGTDASASPVPSSPPSSSDDASESPTAPEDHAASTEPEPEPEPGPEPAADGTRLVVEDSEFGPMLFGATGQAIYLFDVETTSEPRCYEACAEAWPPALTTGEPVAGEGVDEALLATTERTDGTRQVTYAGHPLYFYAHEEPFEVKCHDVFLNGGNWYVVRPDGEAAPPG